MRLRLRVPLLPGGGAWPAPASAPARRAQLGELRPGGGLPPACADWRRDLLTDPQTSGGLLIACDAGAAPEILARIREGDSHAAIVGSAEAGDPIVAVDA